MKIISKTFGGMEKYIYLCNRLEKARAFSSAGLEHLPYKQRVGGSNPSTPTGVFPRSILFGEAAGIFLFMHVCVTWGGCATFEKARVHILKNGRVTFVKRARGFCEMDV